MKKLLTFFLAVGIILWAGNAFCYTIYDSPTDSIRPSGDYTFEIYGIDYNQSGLDLSLSIFTNFPPEGGHTVGSWHTLPGDLAIDIPGGVLYEYGVAFTTHDGFEKGVLYSETEWHLSNHYAPGPFYIWGYDKIVKIKKGSLVPGGDTNFSWDDWNVKDGNGYTPDYKISLSLNLCDFLEPGFDGEIGIYWASATCANDIIEGKVHVTTPIPEPATLLLLGSGLLGLAAFGRAKRKRS